MQSEKVKDDDWWKKTGTWSENRQVLMLKLLLKKTEFKFKSEISRCRPYTLWLCQVVVDLEITLRKSNCEGIVVSHHQQNDTWRVTDCWELIIECLKARKENVSISKKSAVIVISDQPWKSNGCFFNAFPWWLSLELLVLPCCLV